MWDFAAPKKPDRLMNISNMIRLIIPVLLLNVAFSPVVFAANNHTAPQVENGQDQEKLKKKEELKQRHHKRSSTCFASAVSTQNC